MTAAPDLDSLFEQGLLVRPDVSSPDLVHLVRAVTTIAGVDGLDSYPATRQLIDLIGQTSHLVFVLLDGLGMNIVDRLDSGSFLRSSLKTTLVSTCPSTTACALTSVATAVWPAAHAITGWFTYLPEFGLTTALLPFIDRYTGEGLVHRGLHPAQVVSAEPCLSRVPRAVLNVAPHDIANSVYNVFTRGGTRGIAYHSFKNAIDQTIEHINALSRRSSEPTYTAIYFPEIDTLCHKRGVGHESIVPLVMQIDGELRRLANFLRTVGGRLVVTADHGLIDVPEADQTLIMAGDPLLDHLIVPPTGDARTPVFHVKPGHHDAFARDFNARFSDRMVLITSGEAERRRLFGPGDFSPAARRRFGDFIAIAYRPATLAYHPPERTPGKLYIAVHAGISLEEMRIPLCVY